MRLVLKWYFGMEGANIIVTSYLNFFYWEKLINSRYDNVLISTGCVLTSLTCQPNWQLMIRTSTYNFVPQWYLKSDSWHWGVFWLAVHIYWKWINPSGMINIRDSADSRTDATAVIVILLLSAVPPPLPLFVKIIHMLQKLFVLLWNNQIVSLFPCIAATFCYRRRLYPQNWMNLRRISVLLFVFLIYNREGRAMY